MGKYPPSPGEKAINGSFMIGEMFDTILLMETSTNNEK